MKNRASRSSFPEPYRWTTNGSGSRERDELAGKVFVFAAGGLRSASPENDGQEDFLGYAPEEIFWRDVIEVVHEDDREKMWTSIFRIMESPGASVVVRVRLLDAAGGWRPVEAAVQNVLEAPGDGGLLVVNMCPVPAG